MKQDTTLNRLTVTADPLTQLSAADRLLKTLQSSLEGQFELFGELGRGEAGRIVYLAREVASGRLVALQLTPTGTRTVGGEDYWFEVLRTLDANVPAIDSDCPSCHKSLGGWGRFCRHCGVDLSGVAATSKPGSADELLRDVRAVAKGRYDVLGQMDRTEGGGTVYFAREIATGKLVALRLQRENEGSHGTERYSIGVTSVLKSSVAEALGVPRPTVRPKPKVEPTAAQAAKTVVASPAAAVPMAVPVVAPTKPVIAPPVPASTKPVWRPQRDQVLAIAAGAATLIALIWFAATRASRDDDALLIGSAGLLDSSAAISSTILAADSGDVEIGVRLPSGANVRLDGSPVSGNAFRVSTGPHTLTLAAPGYRDVTQQVSVRKQQSLVWTPQLARLSEVGGSVETSDRRTPNATRPVVAPSRASQSARAATPRIDSSPPVSVAATTRVDTASAPALTDVTAVSCGSLFARLEWTRALSTCEDEAKRGSVSAQRTVGTIHERGLGVSPNAQTAAQWYAKAADAGDAIAQFRLGSLLFFGKNGVKKNEKVGLGWIRRAADQQNVEALYTLGQALERGDGVKKNPSEALALFTRTAELGFPLGQTKVGSLFAAGDIVARDERTAVSWFRKAADQGFAEAQYRLGDMYQQGRGVARSDAEADKWFALAAAQGHERARKALKK
jgi:TPR repeat protein